MTESEILTLYIEISTAQMTVLAGWFTITFGLYSIGYLAGDRFKRGTVLFIVLTYTLLTFYSASVMIGYDDYILSLVEDIIALKDNGSQISNMSQILIQPYFSSFSLAFVVNLVSLPLLGIGAISYLIYRHREGCRTVGQNDT